MHAAGVRFIRENEMRELTIDETFEVGGEGVTTAFVIGAGAGGFAGSFMGPGAMAAGALIGGAIGVALYLL